MKKVFRFFAFSVRLTFLLLLGQATRRKIQAAFMITSYSVLMYAAFIICIQPSKNRLRENSDYTKEQAVLDEEEKRIYAIVSKAANLQKPTMITIEPSVAAEAQKKREATEANAISLDDRFFLLEILNRLKDSSSKVTRR